MRSQTIFRSLTSNNLQSSSNASSGQAATVGATEKEVDSKLKDKIIIGIIPECLHPDCKGWIVDTFAGKYWIRCEDPRHGQVNTRVIARLAPGADDNVENDNGVNRIIPRTMGRNTSNIRNKP